MGRPAAGLRTLLSLSPGAITWAGQSLTTSTGVASTASEAGYGAQTPEGPPGARSGAEAAAIGTREGTAGAVTAAVASGGKGGE